MKYAAVTLFVFEFGSPTKAMKLCIWSILLLNSEKRELYTRLFVLFVPKTIMETALERLFLPEVATVDDPSSDHAVLVDWVQEAVVLDEINTVDHLNIPLRIKGIIRAHESFSVLIPVVMKAMVKLNAIFEGSVDVNMIFQWVNVSMMRLNSIYQLLKFDNIETEILRDFEFAIYRKKVLTLWPYFIQSSYTNISPEWFSIASQIGLTGEINRLVYQIGKYQIVKAIDIIAEEPLILTKMKSWIDIDVCDQLQPLLVNYDDQQFLRDSLLSVLYNMIISKRMEGLIDLINLYPQSKSTLDELNECLNNNNNTNNNSSSNIHDDIVSKFIDQINDELLLPSIGTTDIMKFYIKTIRCFLIIDHRGVMLDKVARPIREYLLRRSDTIYKTVNGLLDSNPRSNELIEIHQELLNSSTTVNKTQMSVNAQSFAQYLEWSPEPLEALPDFRVGKIDDIIDSFISIFDDKRVFIDEIVKMFSFQLLKLTKDDYKIVLKDIKFKLALIKKKFQSSDNFGGNEFNVVDIMIHDIDLSNSLDDSIHRATYNPMGSIPTHGVFLSHLYWPTLSPATESKIMDIIPADIKNSIDEYSKKYQMLQKGRYLEFHADQSMVQCNIEVNGMEKSIKAKVLDICVLNWFMENTNLDDNTWKPVKLGMVVVKLGLPLLAVRNALQFWKEMEVLKETNGNWKINE